MRLEARDLALQALLCSEVARKCELIEQITPDSELDVCRTFFEPEPLPNTPGRPNKPELVAPQSLKQRSVSTPDGLAILLHALAHIEFNAINLALDVVWRFSAMPKTFYLDWLKVAREEALHFTLLRNRLRELGYEYGDFPAHNGLWEMAVKTKDDVLARLALVPRTLEARGLDASPAIRDKLNGVGDQRSAQILDVILSDEIGHVAIGNRWYRYVCQERGLDPIQTYRHLAQRYQAPRLRGPFNLQARRQAGFDEQELANLIEG